jgi:hypothetical protein
MCLGVDEGLPARGEGGELVGISDLGMAGFETSTGQLADLGAEAATACGDARSGIVKLLQRQGAIASTCGVGSVGAGTLPDREGQLGRQAVPRTFGDRIECRSIVGALRLGASHPACHRTLTSSRAMSITASSPFGDSGFSLYARSSRMSHLPANATVVTTLMCNSLSDRALPS